MWNDPNLECAEQRFTRRLLVLVIAAAAIGPNAGVDGQPEASAATYPDVSRSSAPTGGSLAQLLETCMAGIDGTVLHVVAVPVNRRLLGAVGSSAHAAATPWLTVAMPDGCNSSGCVLHEAYSSDRPSPDLPCH